MELRIPQEVKEIFAKLNESGFQAYLVGGAVRDLIMGKIVSDWDFTTDATPEEILKIFKEKAFYNNSFGTVGIKSEKYTPHEVTTFRSESTYSDKRRPDSVTWGKSIEEDLKRRDFTINAIALQFTNSKLQETKIIDPFQGKNDIDNKLIRAVGEPMERFNEDALRMMRAIRIGSQLNFKIEEKTLEAIQALASTIHEIASERIKTELFKLLESDHPHEGIALMRETGLLAEVMPELNRCFGVDQVSPERHHIYDVGTHLMMSLKYCPSKKPLVRFAALIHDIGKPQTYQVRDGIITFYNHEVVGARIAKNIAYRLRFSKEETNKLFSLVRWHQFTVDENQTDKAIKRFIRKVGSENLEDMLDLRIGDRIGSGAKETSWRTEEFKNRLIEVQKKTFTIHDLKITGNDIMSELNIEPGPKVGEIMKKLFKLVDDGDVSNEKDALLEEIKKI